MAASNIYLAASYARADEMNGVQSVLEEVGYKVISTWHKNAMSRLDATDVTFDELQNIPEHCREFAIRDMTELRQADMFIMFTGDSSSTGGRHTELGMAMALENILGIVLIGPRENVFQCFESMLVFEDWHTFCMHLFNGLAIKDAKRGNKGALYVKDIVGDFGHGSSGN